MFESPHSAIALIETINDSITQLNNYRSFAALNFTFFGRVPKWQEKKLVENGKYKVSKKRVYLCGKTVWKNPLHVRATALWKWKTQLDDLINMHTRDADHWQMKRDGEPKRGKTLFSSNAEIWLGITLTVGVVTPEWLWTRMEWLPWNSAVWVDIGTCKIALTLVS